MKAISYLFALVVVLGFFGVLFGIANSNMNGAQIFGAAGYALLGFISGVKSWLEVANAN